MDSEPTVEQVGQQHPAVAMALDMPEILEKIFEYLVEYEPKNLISAALVCRKWRDAAYHPSLWRNSAIFLDLQPLDTIQLLPSLARRRINHVSLQNVQTDLRDLLPSLPSLKSFIYGPAVGYSDFVMTDEMLLGALQQRHAALTSFILFDCKYITDASVILLSSRLPNLESLGLTRCIQVTDAGLMAVARGLQHLDSLAMDYCAITDTGLVAVARGLPRLYCLYVDHCAITDAGVAALAGRRPEVAPGTPHLRTLNLSGCGITDSALQHISYGFPKIRDLLVSECVLLTDVGLGHLTSLSKLSRIRVYGSTGISADGLKQLPKLKKKRGSPYATRGPLNGQPAP